MKCSGLKHSGSETKILALDDTRARIGPMKVSSFHMSLTDTGGGYSLEGVIFPHVTP
jgi:hypothetical protein